MSTGWPSRLRPPPANSTRSPPQSTILLATQSTAGSASIVSAAARSQAGSALASAPRKASRAPVARRAPWLLAAASAGVDRLGETPGGELLGQPPDAETVIPGGVDDDDLQIVGRPVQPAEAGQGAGGVGNRAAVDDDDRGEGIHRDLMGTGFVRRAWSAMAGGPCGPALGRADAYSRDASEGTLTARSGDRPGDPAPRLRRP